MAKYKLKALSVHLGGVLVKKEDNIIFDTEKKYKPLKKEIEQAEKAGFLEKIKDEKINLKTNKKK